MRRICIGLALALVAAPAGTQTRRQRDWCFSLTATDDQRIEGCTALIGSGRGTTAAQAAAHDKRGEAHADQGLLDQEIADETQSLALNPHSPNTHFRRALAYTVEGLYDQAIADYTGLIALTPDEEIAYNNRGNLYAQKGLYDLAIADLTRAVALKPDAFITYDNRGHAYEAMGLRGQAVADYRAALKLYPNWRSAREGLTRLSATP